MARKVTGLDPTTGKVRTVKVRGTRRGNRDADSFDTTWPVTEGPKTRWQRFKRDMVG